MFDLALHIHYLERGLLTDHEFCMLQSLDFYRDEHQRGLLTVVAGRETTQRAGRCHICWEHVARGAPNYWSRTVGWVHFDHECAEKIQTT